MLRHPLRPARHSFLAAAAFALLACGRADGDAQALTASAGGPTPAPAPRAAEPPTSAPLDAAVGAFLAEAGTGATDEYQAERLDLNGDGREDGLVLLTAPDWCGSGGCTLLVFEGTDAGFRLVSETSLVNGPLLVAETSTNGWRDILVPDPSADRTVALQHGAAGYPDAPEGPTPQATAGDLVFAGEIGLP